MKLHDTKIKRTIKIQLLYSLNINQLQLKTTINEHN